MAFYYIAVLWALLALAAAHGEKRSEQASQDAIAFFHISDIHLNPYYDPHAPPATYCKNVKGKASALSLRQFPYGKFGCDSPPALLNATLRGMQQLLEDPAFIVVGGDWAGHGMPNQSMVLAMLSEASHTLRAFFPDTVVVPALGNNDFTDDYHYPVNTPTAWMNDIASLWASLGFLSTPQQRSSFLKGGYFAAPLLNDRLRILVLNSLFYSTSFRATNDSSSWAPTPPEELPADPNGQLAWLEGQLVHARADDVPVILSFHIPPGCDAWDESSMWHEKFSVPFDALVLEYHDTIVLHLGAHSHADEFRLLRKPGSESSEGLILMNPAVSPVFNNNPAFRLFTATSDAKSIENYYQYYVDIVKANQEGEAVFELEYEVQKAYQVPDISPVSFDNVVGQLQQSTAVYDQWLMRKYVSHAPKRSRQVCSLLHQSLSDYRKCSALWSDQV
eukprot:TRINITY_DN9308_c0_g1_i1.p1 TRINITY_DN9308_c0_g1~~TRINITY_DN9308_c0_g1_i1.p1  ORF type:complete len:447 (+),score=84.54 TRINITY_DN9308_c0_g1_i1:143-1483(+)